MEKQGRNSLFKVIIALFFQLVLCFSLFFQLFNPFSLTGFKPGSDPQQYFLGWVILGLVISSIFIFDMNIRIERSWFFFYALLFLYVFSVAPIIYCGRLWHTDSAIHLGIIKSIIKFSDPNYKGFWYTSFFYHRLMAQLSVFLNIDPHLTILYVSKLILVPIYYIGVYLLIWKQVLNDPQIKLYIAGFEKYFFLLSLSFGVWLMSDTPWGFITAFSPLVIYLSMNYRKSSLLLLIPIFLMSICTHIQGIFLVIVSTSIIVFSAFFNWRGSISKKCYVYSLLFITIFGIVVLYNIHFFSNIFLFLFNILNIGNAEYFVNPLIKNEKTSFEHLLTSYSLLGFLYNSFSLVIFLFVFLSNQIVLLKSTEQKLTASSYVQLRLLCDFFFLLTISTLFFGHSLLFGRIVLVYQVIFHILTAFYIINLLKFCYITMIEIIGTHNRTKITNFPFSIRFPNYLRTSPKIFLIFLILALTFYPYEPYIPYTEDQYEAVQWLNDYTIENSTVFAAQSLSKLVFGFTIRTTSNYCIYLYLYDYVLIDFHDPYEIYMNGDSYDFPCFSNMETLSSNLLSHNYSIIYNQNFIKIYKNPSSSSGSF